MRVVMREELPGRPFCEIAQRTVLAVTVWLTMVLVAKLAEAI